MSETKENRIEWSRIEQFEVRDGIDALCVTRPTRGEAEGRLAQCEDRNPRFGPYRLVHLVELREGDLFVCAEEMEAAVEKMAGAAYAEGAGLRDRDWFSEENLAGLRVSARVALAALRQTTKDTA